MADNIAVVYDLTSRQVRRIIRSDTNAELSRAVSKATTEGVIYLPSAQYSSPYSPGIFEAIAAVIGPPLD